MGASRSRSAIPFALRRKGTNTLTVRFAGQGDFGSAVVSKKLAYPLTLQTRAAFDAAAAADAVDDGGGQAAGQ